MILIFILYKELLELTYEVYFWSLLGQVLVKFSLQTEKRVDTNCRRASNEILNICYVFAKYAKYWKKKKNGIEEILSCV